MSAIGAMESDTRTTHARYDLPMQFSELPIGAQFKLWARGRVLIKQSEKRFVPAAGGAAADANPTVTVIPAGVRAVPPAEPSDPLRPWGPDGPLVDIHARDAVRLEGVFAPWQLESIQVKLRAKK